MKKINIILLMIVIALIFFTFGFLLGINLKSSNIGKREKEMIGTYKTNTWNGKEAVMVLNENKTMIHPNGYRGTWKIEDNKLFIEYEMNVPIINENGQQEEKKTISKQEIEIVSGGIMINTHFFEKIK